MQPLSALGFIRFDVEDFLTPESDDALAHMLDSMRRFEMPGSYGIVGKKADALHKRGRHEILRDLALESAIGFHSHSHSEHPTLAEELSQLSYADAMTRFLEREKPGVDAVANLVKAPRYFTQPGGNWVPEAVEVLPQLGMDIYFTDSFNSYVVDLPSPYWYGEILHLSFPVVNPRPFGLGLPDNLSQAIEMVEEWQGRSSREAFMVMLHPTELVTYEFWDAVNFSRGRTREPLLPAPVRTPAERTGALESFGQYLQEIRHLNVEWCDAESIRTKLEPRRPVTVSRQELERSIGQAGWGPMDVADGTLSAAEALYALARHYTGTGRESVTVGYVGAPDAWEPAVLTSGDISPERLMAYARGVVDAVERTGRLPSHGVAGVGLERGMAALLGETRPLTFLTYIKEPQDLHWDWPIFPENFAPVRLWQDARRLAWTLKKARFRGESQA